MTPVDEGYLCTRQGDLLDEVRASDCRQLIDYSYRLRLIQTGYPAIQVTLDVDDKKQIPSGAEYAVIGNEIIAYNLTKEVEGKPSQKDAVGVKENCQRMDGLPA